MLIYFSESKEKKEMFDLTENREKKQHKQKIKHSERSSIIFSKFSFPLIFISFPTFKQGVNLIRSGSIEKAWLK